jgi:GT2 family glycosyltransferase
MTAPARVYLVTILYNSRDRLDAFADSLAGQRLSDWRLIAVDNASSDGSAEALERRADGRIALLRNTANLGFARAANQGMRAALDAGAAFVALLNNDEVLPAKFLARFMERRDALRADVIAPRIMRLERPDEAWYAGGHLEDGWIFRNVHEAYDPLDSRETRVVDFASGCCLGLSRHVLETVGLLDERFFVYWEDTDYCLRLKAAGVPIQYVSDVVILHEGGHASGGENSAGFNRLYWRSYARLLRKHFGFAVALRTALRVAAKELGRPNKRRAPLTALLLALARGLVS